MDTEHTQGSLTKEAIRLAWPAVCESFFIALAGMVDTFMVSTLGANAVATVALIGRSLGERDPEKAKSYGAICRRIGLGISVALAVIYFFGGETIYRMFFREENIIAYGVNIIYCICIIVLFQVSQVIYMGCLRGAGDTAYTAVASTISVTLIRTAASYIFGFTLGLEMTGIWMGILADQVSRFLFASIRFRQGKWVTIKI